MEHGYQPKAEQDWSNMGKAPHEAVSNPRLKSDSSKREKAPHEASPVTQY
jgi:hypothetical protein